MNYYVLTGLVLLFTACNGQDDQKSKVGSSGNVHIVNGFEITNPTVPLDAIHQGTPKRDAIPAINDPNYQKGKNAVFMDDEDIVIGLDIGGDVKAYPIKILTWHEIVNDKVGGTPVVISYCPLCHSAYVFSRNINDKVLTFGVSGLLYNSNVIMYDHQTESLWSQGQTEAISGPMKGTMLSVVNSTSTTWADWFEEHPDTQVLSKNTGYDRNYERSPYGSYATSQEIMFPIQKSSNKYHPKALIAGIEVNGKFKAYPITELEKLDSNSFDDSFQDTSLTVTFDEKAEEVSINTGSGSKLNVSHMYWFAWHAFHPETQVFEVE